MRGRAWTAFVVARMLHERADKARPVRASNPDRRTAFASAFREIRIASPEAPARAAADHLSERMTRGQPFQQHRALDVLVDSDDSQPAECLQNLAAAPFVALILDNLQRDLLGIPPAEYENGALGFHYPFTYNALGSDPIVDACRQVA